MNFQVLKLGVANDEAEWKKLWNILPLERQDVFFLPGFLEANENEKRGEGLCAVATEKEAVWIYPFLKCDILLYSEFNGNKKCYDIKTPYGYGGPLVNFEGENLNFLIEVWNSFSNWCLEQNIITEFCRFHPIISNHLWADVKMDVQRNRETIAIDLNQYPRAVWESSYYLNHRGMIRKAIREGFTFHIEDFKEYLVWFVDKYKETQKLLDAKPETFFSEVYFRTLLSKLDDHIWLGVVKKCNSPVTAVVVFEGNYVAYLHLMAYMNQGPTKGMVNYLYHGVAMELAKRGVNFLQVGGGGTNSPNDALFLFKKRLSPVRHNFYVGKKIHNKEIYNELISLYKKKNGENAYITKRDHLQFYE